MNRRAIGRCSRAAAHRRTFLQPAPGAIAMAIFHAPAARFSKATPRHAGHQQQRLLVHRRHGAPSIDVGHRRRRSQRRSHVMRSHHDGTRSLHVVHTRDQDRTCRRFVLRLSGSSTRIGNCATSKEGVDVWRPMAAVGVGPMLGTRSSSQWIVRPPARSPDRWHPLRLCVSLRFAITRSGDRRRGASSCTVHEVVPSHPPVAFCLAKHRP